MQLQQGFATGEMGFRGSLQGSSAESLMSALGQERRFRIDPEMSALPESDRNSRHAYRSSMVIHPW
jgi:hypothetical protein